MTSKDFLTKLQFKTNDMIFKEGDVGDAAYMVSRGKVDIRLGVLGPSPRTLTTIEKGGTFGELALCLNCPRSASAIATENTEVLAVSREDLLMLLEDTSPVVKAMMLNLGKRIIELTDDLEGDKNKVNWQQWRGD